ncbi:hypothetical protein ACODT3_02480 [Streptomyces sp. 4.24]|uniref:hypothetical protein n=1 Tax=Streptomyces tritrimontium TaxID=3406573 RepID=UPI003BB4C88E
MIKHSLSRAALALAFSAALVGLSAQASPAAVRTESRAPLGTCLGCWPSGTVVAMGSDWGQDYPDVAGNTGGAVPLGDGVWL